MDTNEAPDLITTQDEQEESPSKIIHFHGATRVEQSFTYQVVSQFPLDLEFFFCVFSIVNFFSVYSQL